MYLFKKRKCLFKETRRCDCLFPPADNHRCRAGFSRCCFQRRFAGPEADAGGPMPDEVAGGESAHSDRPLRLAVRDLRPRDFLHQVLDLLERHRHRAALHRRSALQRTRQVLRLARERRGMSEASTLQRRRERQRAAGQVVQPLLAVPGRLPAVAALPGHVGVRQAVVEMRGAADGGLRRSHDAAAHRGRVVRRSQRAGARRGEPAARCVASAIGCPADSPAGASQELEPLRVVLSGLGRRTKEAPGDPFSTSEIPEIVDRCGERGKSSLVESPPILARSCSSDYFIIPQFR